MNVMNDMNTTTNVLNVLNVINAAGFLVSEITDEAGDPTGRWEILAPLGDGTFSRVAEVAPRHVNLATREIVEA